MCPMEVIYAFLAIRNQGTINKYKSEIKMKDSIECVEMEIAWAHIRWERENSFNFKAIVHGSHSELSVCAWLYAAHMDRLEC